MDFNFFSEEDLARVFQASIDILKRTGIRTDSARFKTLLADHGCRVSQDVIRFTDSVVEKGLQTVPVEFALYGRNGHHAVRFGQGEVHTQTCVGATGVIDLDSGRKRDCTLQDVAELTRLTDALPFIDLVSPPFPLDVSPGIAVLSQLATMLHGSTKPMRLCVESPAQLAPMIEILAIVTGGRNELRRNPVVYIEVSPVSPLSYGLKTAEAVCDIVEAGIPLGIIPCPMMGATGPMTLAGTVAMHHAEILAGVIASQLLRPNAPVILSPRASFMDMQTGTGLWAMPEMGMMAAACVQLCRKIPAPCTATGFSTAAKTADMQSGYERLYNAMLPALSGADILASAGSLDNARISCHRTLVADNELSSVIKRTMRDIPVNEETLAVDITEEVCRKRSHFLDHEHTFKYFRSPGLWAPPLSVRHTFEEWKLNAQTLEETAAVEARRILESHEVAPLDRTKAVEIELILEKAREVVK